MSNQKNNEWYTPSKYIEAARIVMNGIDLDPASCELANQTVRASRYYTKENNGLMQPWNATSLWCNPPYGRCKGARDGKSISHQQAFAEKLLLEYQRGHVGQAILLSLGNPNSIWFQPFFDFTLCFYRGHLDFYRPDGSFGDFGFPLAFIYFGPNNDKFIEVFSQFGRIVKAIDTPPVNPVTLQLWEDVG